MALFSGCALPTNGTAFLACFRCCAGEDWDGPLSGLARSFLTLNLGRCRPLLWYWLTVLTHPTVPASWLESPPIVAARTRVAKELALLVSVLALGLFAIERFVGVPLDADSYLSLFLAGAGLVAWFLLQKQYYAGAAWFLVACLRISAHRGRHFKLMVDGIST